MEDTHRIRDHRIQAGKQTLMNSFPGIHSPTIEALRSIDGPVMPAIFAQAIGSLVHQAMYPFHWR
jgi:hypothetical protein